jgi:Kef-type K+ transport system membrane component KefB
MPVNEALIPHLIAAGALAAPLPRWMSLKWAEAIVSAPLLSAPLTLLVATAQVGINPRQLSPTTQGVAIGAAVVSAIVFPLLARPLARAVDRLHLESGAPSMRLSRR